MIIRKHMSEIALKEIAKGISERIAIREYDNGNSRDTWRETDEQEANAIFTVAYGALLSLNWGEDARGKIPAVAQGIIDTAEFTLDLLIRPIHGEECNGYMTIYCPLKKAVREWEAQA